MNWTARSRDTSGAGVISAVKVVGHDHERMQEIFALLAICKEDLNEQIGGSDALEDRFPLGGDRSDEECAVHLRNVAHGCEERCERNHVEIVQLKRGMILVEARALSVGL